MKTFKKALSIILGAAIMLSCLFGMQVSVAAEGTTLEVAVGEATVADGVVSVPVVVTNNPGFQTLAVTVGYDNTVLTLTGAAKNADFATAAAPGNDVPAEVGEISPDFKTIHWAYVAEAVTATGTIATFTFAVAEGATAESTEITLTLAEAWDGANDVTANATAGTVDLVKEPEEPEVDPALVLTPGIRMGDTCLEISYSLMGDLVAEYDDFYLEINRKTFGTLDRNSVDAETVVITKAQATNYGNGYLYAMYCADIPMYDLSVDVNAVLYCVDNGVVTTKSNVYTNSVASLVKDYYAVAKDDVTKRIYTDILNLAAEAQAFFGAQKPDSELAAKPLVNEGFVGTPTDDSAWSSLNSIKNNVTESGSVTVSNYLGIGAVPAPQYVIMGASETPANVKMVLKYTGGKTGEVTETVYGTDADKGVTSMGNGMYAFSFTKMALLDTNAAITFEIYDGETLCVTNTYSIDSYVAENLGNASQAALLKAIAKIGNSARAYFKVG